MPWVACVTAQRVLIQCLDGIRSRQSTQIEWTPEKAVLPQ